MKLDLRSLPQVSRCVIALPVAGRGCRAQANSNHAPEIAHQSWSFTPPFGTFDNAQLQRGFQVYKEVCANCHSMRLLSYRNLGEPGGPQFSPKAVEILASQVQVTDGPNDKGEMFQRPARPSDRFRSPFANDQLARNANNGALPPDLSVMAKAREGGPDYIYALLTGYQAGAARFRGGAGHALQRRLSRPSDRHAAAFERRRGRLYRRHQADARQLRAGTSRPI